MDTFQKVFIHAKFSLIDYDKKWIITIYATFLEIITMFLKGISRTIAVALLITIECSLYADIVYINSGTLYLQL